MKKPLQVAVLGAGRIGQVHGATITSVSGAVLRAISDPVLSTAEAMRERYGCDVRTISQIEKSDDIDAVIICTPTDTHAGLIEQFSRAGKAVFCEKPIDLDVARVIACLKVVDETDTTLMIGFQRRFDPDFGALKQVIKDGKIGSVEIVTLTSRDPGAPPHAYIERSGGIFRDMTIHDFDVARWLLDEEIHSVFAAASVLVDDGIGALGDFDSVNVILTTASGKQATITNTRRATYGYDQRIEVHGSIGSVSAANHHRSRVEIATDAGYTRPPLLDFFMTRYTEAYSAEIEAFVAAVQHRTAPPTTGHDGLMALVLAEAANRSVQAARAIEISEILE